MNQKTMDKFNAPWYWDKMGMEYIVVDKEGFEVCSTNHEVNAKELRMLPEMYEALLEASFEVCYQCCGEEVAFPETVDELIDKGCPRKSPCCHCQEWLKLLKKFQNL